MKKLAAAGAFSLVELTLALSVAAFCLLGVFALMPVGVQTNRNATSQTAAVNIMAAVVADLRATPKTNTTSPQFGITFGTNRCVNCAQPPLYFDSAGQSTTSLDANSRCQLNVTWNVANSTGACSAAVPCADLKVTWPAAATTANASGSAETFAAFYRN
ncbi:MAG TPA: hypothetical protein VGM65_10980 [Candidatus Udaeobacter sp.]|jgi:uncharacterized protein (TIGR02598 family)